eukprot:scaffold291998_cov27-Tisochrysis_lutea.AAC.2
MLKLEVLYRLQNSQRGSRLSGLLPDKSHSYSHNGLLMLDVLRRLLMQAVEHLKMLDSLLLNNLTAAATKSCWYLTIHCAGCGAPEDAEQLATK